MQILANKINDLSVIINLVFLCLNIVIRIILQNYNIYNSKNIKKCHQTNRKLFKVMS